MHLSNAVSQTSCSSRRNFKHQRLGSTAHEVLPVKEQCQVLLFVKHSAMRICRHNYTSLLNEQLRLQQCIARTLKAMHCADPQSRETTAHPAREAIKLNGSALWFALILVARELEWHFREMSLLKMYSLLPWSLAGKQKGCWALALWHDSCEGVKGLSAVLYTTANTQHNDDVMANGVQHARDSCRGSLIYKLQNELGRMSQEGQTD